MKSITYLGLMLAGALAWVGCDDSGKAGADQGAKATTKATAAAKDEAAKDKAPPKGDTKPADTKSAAGAKLDEAKKLLGEFLAEGADHAALSKKLEPKDEDYAAVFVGDAAEKAKSTYAPLWKDGTIKIAPKAGQTELLLWAATTEQLKAGEGDADKFPGGYKKVVDQLKPGVVFYRFKFVEPGKTLGMAFDGLVYVNDHWTVFPKPWRALR
jgi:hypothetical protein